MGKLKQGQVFPPLALNNIHGAGITVPDTAGRRTHLQFRRFAGCPICNLHLQDFIRRHGELEGAGVREAVVFHSSDAELLPYQGRFPFDVIGDPQKKLYRKLGVENSLLSILHPGAWPAGLRGNLARDRPELKGMPNGGVLSLPADFLVGPDGTVEAVHYGNHADDQWSVDEVLALARR